MRSALGGDGCGLVTGKANVVARMEGILRWRGR